VSLGAHSAVEAPIEPLAARAAFWLAALGATAAFLAAMSGLPWGSVLVLCVVFAIPLVAIRGAGWLQRASLKATQSELGVGVRLSEPQSIALLGELCVPTLLYRQEAQIVRLRLKANLDVQGEGRRPVNVLDSVTGKIVMVVVMLDGVGTQFLEIEWSGPGFTFKPDSKQRRPLLLAGTDFEWSVMADYSGAHDVTIEVRLIGSDGQVVNLGRLNERMTVLEFVGLTARQLRIAAGITGAATGLLGTLHILKQLGIP